MTCALVGMTAFGCGDGDKPLNGAGRSTVMVGPAAGTNAGSGGRAGASSAGTGGSASAGAGGRAGLGGPVPMQPVVCGGVTCAVTSPRLGACCLADGSCGLGTGTECQAPNQPGDLDPSCPSHEVATAGLVLMGCCKPGNQCGVMSMSGLGCVERTQLATFAGGPLDALVCGGADVDGGAEDAGSEDEADDARDAGTDDSADGALCPWPPRRPGRLTPPGLDAGLRPCSRLPAR